MYLHREFAVCSPCSHFLPGQSVHGPCCKMVQPMGGPVSSPERSFELKLAAVRIVVVRRGPTRHEFAERAAAVPGDWAQWGGRGLRG